MNFKKVNNSFASMVVSQVYLLNCDISTKENGSWNYNTEGEETHGDRGETKSVLLFFLRWL